MASNKHHHVSKSNRFTLIFAREEDAATSRSFRIIPWVMGSAIVLGSLLVGAGFYALVTLTPLATYIPLPNPALENKYGQELLALNVRMLRLMEELVQLRTYNVKLRSALGEKLSPEDSAAATVAAETRPTATTPPQPPNATERRAEMTMGSDAGRATDHQQFVQVVDRMAAVSFPAILPAQGYVTRGYSAESGHWGLDIAAKTGTVVSAAADGAVLFSGWTEDDGNMLAIAHSGGFVTVYKHNQSLLRRAGAFVRRGEAIATLGNTGRTSLGPHLHFEVWKDGVSADPALYVLNLTM